MQKKYAENMPLHRLQHSKFANYMQKICKNNAQYATKYAKNMQLICRTCISLCIGIFCIYMHSPLCWCESAALLNAPSRAPQPLPLRPYDTKHS